MKFSKKEIPYGDVLRQVLVKRAISAGEINSLLKERGVYCSEPIKEKTIPVLMKSLLSPSEFYSILESYKQREERLKISSEIYPAESCQEDSFSFDDFDLSRVESAFLSDVNKQHNNFKVKNNLDIYYIDENHAKLTFVLDKQDLTKDWDQVTTEHEGSLEIRIENETFHIMMNYTNLESKEAVEALKKVLIDQLKTDGLIAAKKKPVLIMYQQLTAQQRRDFFVSLSSSLESNKLLFKQIKDFKFFPIQESRSNLEDTELSWAADKLESITLTGSGLEKLNILNDDKIYLNLRLNAFEVVYEWNDSNVKAECVVFLNFPQVTYESDFNMDSKFEMSVKSLKTNCNSGFSKTYITEKILKELERHKNKYLMSINI